MHAAQGAHFDVATVIRPSCQKPWCGNGVGIAICRCVSHVDPIKMGDTPAYRRSNTGITPAKHRGWRAGTLSACPSGCANQSDLVPVGARYWLFLRHTAALEETRRGATWKLSFQAAGAYELGRALRWADVAACSRAPVPWRRYPNAPLRSQTCAGRKMPAGWNS
jgi:hypothetical protein